MLGFLKIYASFFVILVQPPQLTFLCTHDMKAAVSHVSHA